MKKSLKRFASLAQLLQFLSKEYGGEHYYKKWKYENNIIKARDLEDEELIHHINYFEILLLQKKS